MMKILRCGELMPGCDFVARAETDEQLLEIAARHAQAAHGVEMTAELADKVRSVIRVDFLPAG